MTRKPIAFNDDNDAILQKMSEGDIGARIIAHTAIQHGGSLGPSELLRLDDMGLRGSDLVVATFANAYASLKEQQASLEAIHENPLAPMGISAEKGAQLLAEGHDYLREQQEAGKAIYERDKFDPKALIKRLWEDMKREVAEEEAHPRVEHYNWKAHAFRSEDRKHQEKGNPHGHIPPNESYLHDHMGVTVGLHEPDHQQRLVGLLNDKAFMKELGEVLPELPKLSVTTIQAGASFRMAEQQKQGERGTNWRSGGH